MSVEFLLDMAWKSLLCAAAALLLLRLFENRSAAAKSLLAHLGVLAVLGLPVAAAMVPAFKVDAPGLISNLDFSGLLPGVEGMAAQAALAGPALPEEAGPGGAALLILAYAIPAVLLLLLGLSALLRLHLLRARAFVLVDPAWTAALDSARRRLRFRRDVALLISGDVAAPISWGLFRPVILVDPRTAAEPDHAEAVVAHELAHFTRLDWPALLLARLATAMFWFNPLLWMLARRAQDFSEQAADDEVLLSDIAAADYADLLVGSARCASAPMLLAANGLASGSSLGRRVLSALDPSRRRAAAHAGWWLAALVGGLGAGASLAAVDPQVKAEPVKMESVRAGPVRAEPVRAEPVRAMAAPTLLAAAQRAPARATIAAPPSARPATRPGAAKAPCRHNSHRHRARTGRGTASRSATNAPRETV